MLSVSFIWIRCVWVEPLPALHIPLHRARAYRLAKLRSHARFITVSHEGQLIVAATNEKVLSPFFQASSAGQVNRACVSIAFRVHESSSSSLSISVTNILKVNAAGLCVCRWLQGHVRILEMLGGWFVTFVLSGTWKREVLWNGPETCRQQSWRN